MSVLKEKCKVFMLPAEKMVGAMSSSMIAKQNSKLYNYFSPKYSYDVSVFQHLYIISNDEIKEGDYTMSANSKIWYMVKKEYKDYLLSNPSTSSYRKIIATTDSSLKKSKFSHYSQDLMKVAVYKETFLPQPSQGFIEKYVKMYNEGNPIKEVLVEYENPHYFNYWSDGLKVNSKDNTITIHPVKDSWSREEVSGLLIKHQSDYRSHVRAGRGWSMDILKWIEENL